MKYLVIGLGTLGRAIAENLTRIGHEVLGVDRNMQRVELVKHSIAGAIALDSTDCEALNTLPLTEMDAVIVTYGKDFGSSVLTVSLLKSFDTGRIIVRSISPIHETVIRAIGVEEIITPEADFAATYASLAMLGNLFNHRYQVTDTHHLYKVVAPDSLVGQRIGTVEFEDNFGVRLIGIERPSEQRNLIGIKHTRYTIVEPLTNETAICAGDRLILFGRMEVLYKLKEI